MFPFGRSSAFALQLYGKVPLAKDYLRIGCGEGAGRELREWMDLAFSTQAANAGVRRLVSPMRFVLGSDVRSALVGCLWNSSDAGGLRSFPLALFVDVPQRRAPDALDRGLARERSVWSQLEGVRARLAGFADARELLAELRGVALEPSGPAATGDVAPEFEPWLAAVWPHAREAGLRQTFESIRRDAGDRHHGTLVVPLAPEWDAEVQVTSWLGALRALGWWGAKERPSLLFPSPSAASSQEPGAASDATGGATSRATGDAGSAAAGCGPRLICLRRPLQPQDAELLTNAAAGSSILHDTGALGGEPAPLSGAPHVPLAQGLSSAAVQFLGAAT